MSSKPTKTPKPVPPPKLRFKGFEGEWKKYKGNRLFSQVSNKDHDSNLPILAVTQERGAVPRSEIDYHVSVTKESLQSYKVVEIGDFIISLRSFQGGIEYSNYLGICSPAYVILRGNDLTSSEYFKSYFKSERFIRALTKNLEGLRDGKMISYKQFAEFEIPLPSLPEQAHIAAALSSLDAVITAEAEALEALRQHKRGLMQQLFPQEGKRVPRVRFAEFAEAGEWEERKLGELGTFRGGGTPSKEVEAYWTGDIPWVSSSDIDEDDIRRISVTRFISEEAIKNTATKKIPTSSVLFVSRVGVGKLAVTDREICTSQDFISFKPKLEDKYFIAYYFKSKSSLLVSLGQGMAIKGFTKGDLESLSISIPPLPEQERIAAVLSSLDELLAVRGEKLERLRHFKRGLMQGLFPRGGEV